MSLGGWVAVPTDFAILHRSFVRSLRAENRAPRTVETYSLSVDQFAAHLAARDDVPATMAELQRSRVEDFLEALLAPVASLISPADDYVDVEPLRLDI